MNREIKFRVWNGVEMVYDIITGKFGTFYVNPSNNGIDERDSACLSPLNTKYPDGIPLMQFTGLKDKNGKEIYEGDVVVAKSDGYTHKGEIRWRLEGAPTIIIYPAFANEGFWSLHGHKIEPGSATITVFGKVEYHKGDKTIIIDDGVEVIGNIHETTPA